MSSNKIGRLFIGVLVPFACVLELTVILTANSRRWFGVVALFFAQPQSASYVPCTTIATPTAKHEQQPLNSQRPTASARLAHARKATCHPLSFEHTHLHAASTTHQTAATSSQTMMRSQHHTHSMARSSGQPSLSQQAPLPPLGAERHVTTWLVD